MRYCSHCNTHHPGPCPNKERRRGSSTQRGYDSHYATLARRLVALHAHCAHCGSTKDLTIDHIIALTKGGTHARHNLQVLCRKCNSSKRDGRGVGKHRDATAQRPMTRFSRNSLTRVDG